MSHIMIYHHTRNFFVKRFCLAIIAVLVPLSLPALDWGLTTDHTVSQEGVGATTEDTGYQGIIAPWLSALPGKNMDLYVSAAFTVSREDGDWTYVPELFRASFSMTFNEWEIHMGRIPYADPLGFILSGLFDGASCVLDTSSGSASGFAAGTFNAGLWYTGLLYKKTANITVTKDDLDSYYETFSYDKFADTYAASRRLAFALGWEHPGLAELVRLRVSLLGQADLNGRETKFHSQYLDVHAGLPLGDSIVLDAGGALGFAEVSQVSKVSPEFQISLAGELGLSWYLPGALQDRLRFTGIITSGKDGGISAFVPVSTVSQGSILKAKLSGVSMLALEYTARLHQTFSLNASSSYFVLSDMGTYQGWPAKRDGHFLGNEFYLRLIWSPFSDLQLNLGSGLFVPAMGDTDPNAGLRWKVELNATLAIF